MLHENDQRRTAKNLTSGAGIWFLFIVADLGLRGGGTGWIERLFLTGPLLIVPAALRLLETMRGGTGRNRLWRWTVFAQPIAAGLLATSFFGRPGYLLTFLLGLPWILFCGALPVLLLVEIATARSSTGTDLLTALGAGLLPVGGFWLAVDRLGAGFMGITYPITLLTAVHFHFTGFAVPVLVAGLYRFYEENEIPIKTVGALAAGGLLAVGIPLVAGGFIYSQGIKTAGVLLLLLSMTVVALLMFAAMRNANRFWTKTGFAVAGGSILGGMGLAAVYQISLHLGTPMLTIPQMTITHGVLNSFGFLLCGLFATHALLTGGRYD